MPKKSPKRLEDCKGIPVQKSFARIRKMIGGQVKPKKKKEHGHRYNQIRPTDLFKSFCKCGESAPYWIARSK